MATRAAAVLAAAAGVGAVQWWILTTLSDHATHDFSTLEHVLIGARAAWTHLYLGIVPGPSPLAMRTWEVDRGDPFGWMAVAAGIVAVAVAAWGWRRGAPRAGGPRCSGSSQRCHLCWGCWTTPSLHMSMVWGHHRYPRVTGGVRIAGRDMGGGAAARGLESGRSGAAPRHGSEPVRQPPRCWSSAPWRRGATGTR